MPELPDLQVYLDALERRIVGQRLEKARLLSPFVLRSVEPALTSFEGSPVTGLRRIGKRIVLEFPNERYLAIHLMVSGRLRWRNEVGARLAGKIALASFAFAHGTLFLTEASKKKRASLTALAGESALRAIDPGGLEPLACGLEAFSERLRRENHTLKRALTTPALFSGIGNAYSDEILNAAGLSPVALTRKLDDAAIATLFQSTQSCLREWTERLRNGFADRFPDAGEIPAFRPDFCVHGKFGQPCGRCGAPVQRIRYAENETNYCPRCQTGGRILADRSLSRLLKSDWPRSLDEL